MFNINMGLENCTKELNYKPVHYKIIHQYLYICAHMCSYAHICNKVAVGDQSWNWCKNGKTQMNSYLKRC